MHSVHVSNRGQVLIIFVFAIIGLIAMTGLAIDGANILSDRRHAQNAADTAAMAASLKRLRQEKGMRDGTVHPISDCTDLTSGHSDCGNLVKLAAMDLARENGYTGDLVNSTVEVYTPPIDPPYNAWGSTYTWTDYIEVVINTNVDTWFARILGVGQLHNRVTAIARATYSKGGSLYGGNSLVELRPTSGPGCGSGSGTGGGDVYLGGSSGLILDGGGIFVNSNNPDCSLKITNTCPPIQLLNGAIVQGMGGQFPGCAPNILQPATEGYIYPPENSPVSPIPPDACNGPIITSGGVPNTDGTFHFAPGHYAQLPPDKNTTLEPGVYCVDNLIKTTNSFTFMADGAFMYVKTGGQFNFQGGTIKLVAPGLPFCDTCTPKPVAPATQPYKGYLIYVDETDWAGAPGLCNVNAGSDTVLKGVIYAPHCRVTINGGSGTIGLSAQVIAYTLDLTGGATLKFTYDATKMPGSPEQMITTLSR